MSPSRYKHTAVCQFCEREIYRYVNRSRPSDWMHTGSKLTWCWRTKEFRKEEVATPKPGSVRA